MLGKEFICLPIIDGCPYDQKRLIKSIEELNKKQIEELKKKDQWTNEEVEDLFGELNKKYQYLIDEIDS